MTDKDKFLATFRINQDEWKDFMAQAKAEGNSYLAPLRKNPGNVKRCAIRLPDFYRFLSLNQGLKFSTE